MEQAVEKGACKCERERRNLIMRGLVKGIILVLMVIYIISPIDACPGPIDDIIVLLIGIAATKGNKVLEG